MEDLKINFCEERVVRDMVAQARKLSRFRTTLGPYIHTGREWPSSIDP
jgi:hypothetical protein